MVVMFAAKPSVSFRCLALLPMATESVMARITGEEFRSLMPTKDAGLGPIAFLKVSSMSVNVTNHIYYHLLLCYCLITIYRYLYIATIRYIVIIPTYSGESLEPGKFGLPVDSCSVLSSTTEIVMPVSKG